MSDPNLNNLRSILDEYETYVAEHPSNSVADRMRSAIAEARQLLQPSPDGTANYVDTKAIVERLAALRKESEAK